MGLDTMAYMLQICTYFVVGGILLDALTIVIGYRDSLESFHSRQQVSHHLARLHCSK